MSNRPSQVGLGLIIEDEAFDTIRELQLKIASSTSNSEGLKQPPHITIKQPFTLTHISIEKITAIVDKIAAMHQAIEVSLNRFDDFAGKVLYLGVENDELLIPLQTNIKAALDELSITGIDDKHSSTVFHVTLAQNLSGHEFSNSMSLLEKHYDILPLTTKMLKVGLFMNVDDQWIIVYQKDLKRV